MLYKAVSDEYKSTRGFLYEPGSTPVAEDWDGGERECGGGLHWCSTPRGARKFFLKATRFLACPVAIVDLAVHQDAQYPDKIKGRGCCAPIFEVDIDGNPFVNPTTEEKAI